MKIKMISSLTMTLLLVSTVASQAQWSQYQGNAAHTGYVPGAVNPSNFKAGWQYSGTNLTALAVNENGVFVGQTGYFSTTKLIGINQTNGQQKWQLSLNSNGYGVSAPSVQGNNVYIHNYGHSSSSNSPYPDAFPRMIGVNATTGGLNFATTHEGQWNSGSRPSIEGNQVVSLGGYYGGMDSYNATTGSRQWSIGMPQQYGFIPALDSKYAYVYYGAASASPGPQVSSLYVIQRSTGALIETIQNPSEAFTTSSSLSSAVLGGRGDVLTIGDKGYGFHQITSFDVQNSRVKWQSQVNATYALAVAGGIVAVPASNALFLLDQDTGLTLRQWTAPQNHYLVSNVLLTDNLAFVATDQALYGISLMDGSSVWSSPYLSGLGNLSNLAYYNNTLYASNNTTILSFNLSPTAVPEPSGILLVLLGLGGIGLIKRRASTKSV